ncbi:MAG: hypothetical protein P4L67_05050 [Candidatus Pacebacteria bacterium]|nr:hypothetical protein [Candidatus Paceibacterota bacterium]
MDSHGGSAVMRIEFDGVGPVALGIHTIDVRLTNGGVGGSVKGVFGLSDLPDGLLEYLQSQKATAYCILTSRNRLYSMSGKFRIADFSAKITSSNIASYECVINGDDLPTGQYS